MDAEICFHLDMSIREVRRGGLARTRHSNSSHRCLGLGFIYSRWSPTPDSGHAGAQNVTTRWRTI